MRNAVQIDELTILTIDNSGCIGEKEADAVKVPNEVVAYFAARVALLEQWCAGAEPSHLVLANFTGDDAWADYVRGCQRQFDEIGKALPPITGSTESNFSALQSGLSLTMVGKKCFEPTIVNCHYFVIGRPLVGQQVLEHIHDVANLHELYLLWQTGVIQALWPCGSKGIGAEIVAFTRQQLGCELNMTASAGPATAVLVAVHESDVEKLYKAMSAPIYRLK
ncbi:hypothetical protein P9B03_15900 [Metasolibacillus meyeri]|uniref:Alpha-ribazole kinase n=1 Tax=Metasolibacillus meyeri TaxID=1071052 RepID=A0AAW9NVN6_9BACL|nr:hypothetical protein [Metasolibacillus meyeri]MEC1179984.1 hypothetical protein [Metasolibacillus meyeri]